MCFGLVEREVDLSERKTGQRNIELEIDKGLQLERQDLDILARVESQLVVRQDVRSPLFGR